MSLQIIISAEYFCGRTIWKPFTTLLFSVTQSVVGKAWRGSARRSEACILSLPRTAVSILWVIWYMTVVAGSKPTVVSANLLHPAQYSDTIYFPWRQYCYPKSIFTMKTFQLIKRILSLLIFKTSQFNISHAYSLARPYSVLFWKLRRSRGLNGWHVGVTDNQVPENKVAGLRRDAASPSTGKTLQ